jgi:O-antigen/teichoic acid export membrane protein
MTSERASEIVIGEETVTAMPSEMRGLHAGAIVFVGMAAANLGNYVFHFLTARSLGPGSYGDVATLAAIAGIIALPLGGVQVFVARHVAAEAARRDPFNADRYVSAFSGAMAVSGGVLTLLFLIASPLVQDALSIRSLSAVMLTALYTLPCFVGPALVGAAQGRQRFVLVAASVGVPPIARIAFVAIALAAGFGVSGAMAATFLAAIVGVVLPFVALRHAVGGIRDWRPRISKAELAALAPVLGGLLAITALSTDDLVVAKIAFSNHEAGLYGSASLIGRVVLYLPAAIATVLLPKVSARAAERRDSRDILLQSALVTVAFCAAATAFYALVPHLVVRIAFGSKYEGTASLLWMFGIAMTLYALLNVILTYRLGNSEASTSWLLLGAAVAQGILFAIFHASPRELLTVSILVGAVALLANELVVAPTLMRSAWRRSA